MAVQQFDDLIKDRNKFIRHLLAIVLISLTLALVSLFFADQSISLFFARPLVRAQYWQLARDITHVGLSEHYFILAIGSWIVGAWVGPKLKLLAKYKIDFDFIRRWGLNFLAALLVSGVLTHIIKFLVGRQRPHKSPIFDPFAFEPFNIHWHWQSFASGHSQVMFTAATMLTIALPRWRWVWISVATTICITRVVIHDHFLSDIMFGACLGYVGTLMSLKLMQERTKNGLY